MKTDELQGVLPVLQTPFTESYAIDVSTLEREIDWAFQTGADGVVCAMVSETLRLGYHVVGNWPLMFAAPRKAAALW